MKKRFKSILKLIIKRLPYLKAFYETSGTAAPITIKTLFFQKILGFNREAYWPAHFTSKIIGPKNILIGIGTAPGLSPGCYIQGLGKIYIGDYTIIGPNVGIISANHKVTDHRKHDFSEVKIGKYCWIGMNSVIMPGVELGDYTIVGAGSVVTNSFPEGYCIIGGTPAKIIRSLDRSQCIHFENQYKYYGYIKAEKFDRYRKRKLNV